MLSEIIAPSASSDFLSGIGRLQNINNGTLAADPDALTGDSDSQKNDFSSMLSSQCGNTQTVQTDPSETAKQESVGGPQVQNQQINAKGLSPTADIPLNIQMLNCGKKYKLTGHQHFVKHHQKIWKNTRDYSKTNCSFMRTVIQQASESFNFIQDFQ